MCIDVVCVVFAYEPVKDCVAFHAVIVNDVVVIPDLFNDGNLFHLSVEGVEVAVCLLETGKERFKVSLRSKGKADVNAVASVYGGGGHILASGCMLNGCLEEVIDKLRYTVKQHLVL